ncbi:hypothetical protein [Sporomusa malonica]|uniref:MULE transposase domain-containing protein n=1 Tax=Sporomusa malonica TaxID=112901 RepID=A0A1W1Y9Y3_9FIRM|nr:hypothetical protein [Sporomusa malonica]SMC32945.1 hypothetical protein SAMN04488500_101158 [Sporomusa malonica]
MKTNGGIMLSMDGVQPEKGNETLYVVREVFSGTIFAAENVKSSATEELKALNSPIVKLGFPIIGIISDGQQSIRMAMESLLPDVPYQYCQYHYLKDIAKPVVDLVETQNRNQKKLRGIRDLERKLEQNRRSTERNSERLCSCSEVIALRRWESSLDLFLGHGEDRVCTPAVHPDSFLISCR